MKKLILSALVLATMASCTKIETGGVPERDPNAIVFGGSIEAGTKAIADDATEFPDMEEIGVFGYKAATAGATRDFSTPFLNDVTFAYDAAVGAKLFATTDALAVWEKGKAHNFYAYYPKALAPTKSSSGIIHVASVAAGTGLAHDIMAAKVELPVHTGALATRALNFKHALSKVKFKIKKESRESPVLTRIDFKMGKNSAVVDLVSGVVSLDAGGSSVGLNKDLAATPFTIPGVMTPVPGGSWLVLPGDVISDMILVIDGKRMKVSGAIKTAQTEAGKITNINITVRSGEMTFSSSIEAWGNNETDIDELEPSVSEPNMLYDSPDVDKTDMVGSTEASYNRRTGTVADGDNGSYQTTATAAYSAEKPFYKLEVALGDGAVTRASVSWSDARDMCLNLATDGGGWRLPRYSELRMMYNNRTNLESSTNFAEFDMATTYVSGTESDLSNVWVVDFATGEGINNGGRNNSSFNVRCVREIRLEAKIGYYVYSDNSISDEFALPSPMDYVVGLIYRVEKNNPKKVMIVTPFEYKQYWHGFNNKMISGATDTVSGLANRATIKALQVKNWFGASALCDTLNRDGVTGWCLPSKNELRALYAGYCGLRMVGKDGRGENLGDSEDDWGKPLIAYDSPEIAGTGEIPLWYRHPTRSMPGNDNYTAARAYFNAQLTAMGTHKDATPFREEAANYWSSSEYTGEEEKSANDNNDGDRKTALRTERAYALSFTTGAITSIMNYCCPVKIQLT